MNLTPSRRLKLEMGIEQKANRTNADCSTNWIWTSNELSGCTHRTAPEFKSMWQHTE